MTYRIRYRKARSIADAVALVEANSPTEALVKFRCTLNSSMRSWQDQDVVTSVCLAEAVPHVGQL